MHNRFLKQIQGICWRGKVSKEREAISMYELENDDEIEIDLRELFLALKKKIVWILLTTIVFAGAAGLITKFAMTPVLFFQCTALCYV